MNCTDIPIIAKYIAENNKYILFAQESNNITEEKKMIDDVDDGELIKVILQKKEEEAKQVKEVKEEKEEKKPEESRNSFITSRSNSLKSVPNSEEDKTKTKNEDKFDIKNIITAKKRFSTKYVFPNRMFLARDSKRKVTITNINELNKNRFENIEKDIIKRRTFVDEEIHY